MPLNQMGNFTFNHVDQQDDLYKTKTAAEIKAALDSRGIDLKTFLNGLVTQLQSTTADSGAKNLGVNAISGVTGANIQAVLEDLKLQINGAVAGTIPDGTITQAKLAFEIATDAASTTIADAGAHFTSTNVEGALDELFTSANSVKTNVSGAIGSPATVNDTGVQLASKITTEKGRIASEVGDGTSADSLKYLTDRLVVRSDAIATAVNAKGVASTSADTLAQLATKIGQISTGKKFASGTVTSSSTSEPFIYAGATSSFTLPYVTVTGLDFVPSVILITASNADRFSIYRNNGLVYPLIVTVTNNNTTTTTSSQYAFKADQGTANVTSTGFALPVIGTNTLFNWKAFE